MKIEIIKHCPSCGSKLELVNSQLFCRNTYCPAQSTKKVEAFIKKMKIKGLGPANIEKLDFSSPLHIYYSPKEYYIKYLGQKIGEKVFEEVQNSKTTTFPTFVAALSIPLIGDTAAKKIGTMYNSFKEIIHGSELLPIGEKANDNFFNWLAENERMVLELENLLSFTEKNSSVPEKGKVCITGKLQDFSNRNDAKEFLERYGYTVVSGVSSKTDYLIDEEGKASSKRQKAEQLNIPIVTIKQLIEV